MALLLLSFKLFDGAVITDLVKNVSHVSLSLVGLLKFVEHLLLLNFEPLGNLIGLISIVLLVFDSPLVATLQVVEIHISNCVEMRFCTSLIILHSLKLSLLFFQESDIICMNHLIDSICLIFEIIVHISITLKCSLHALHNSGLRMNSVLVKFSSVVLFSFQQEVHMILLFREAMSLLVIHI